MRKTIIPVILFMIISIISCKVEYITHEVPKTEYQIPGAEKSVCILTYGSDFKLRLAEMLAADFNARQVSVIVDSISNMSRYPLENYDAVILMSAIQGFSPLPLAADYITANNYSKKIVYFSPYTLFAAPYGVLLDGSKIDAVTAASSTNDIKGLKDAENQIAAKTYMILGMN